MDNSWAAPGVRCVCIDDTWSSFASCDGYQVPVRVPMIGEVMTIRAVDKCDLSGGALGGVEGEPYLTFWEIEARQKDGPLSATVKWWARHFRPLTERETDISVLEALLNTEREPANV